VGTRVYGIRLDQVVETMRPLPIEPLAGVPSFVLGLSVLRGMPVPVIDLASLLGAASPVKSARFVAVRAGDRTALLAVESVTGVTALQEQMLESLPPLVRDMSAQALDTIGRLDEGMLFVLKSGHIVPDAVWDSLEARGPGPDAHEASA
jgi:purine-binding chemotaxis protein CheW